MKDTQTEETADAAYSAETHETSVNTFDLKHPTKLHSKGPLWPLTLTFSFMFLLSRALFYRLHPEISFTAS